MSLVSVMSESNNTIVDGSVVTMHYTLKLDDGETVDSSVGQDPLVYLHGAQNIVPGLESQLTGKAPGAKLDVVVVPEEGYGPRFDGTEKIVPREELPPNFDVEPGMPISAQSSDGQEVTLFVTSVCEESITVDMNHPLAGQNLNFAIEVLELREASAEEQEHGHPHGPGGHHH